MAKTNKKVRSYLLQKRAEIREARKMNEEQNKFNWIRGAMVSRELGAQWDLVNDLIGFLDNKGDIDE